MVSVQSEKLIRTLNKIESGQNYLNILQMHLLI